MTKLTMKQGDLTPKISAVLTTGNPASVLDLNGCTVRLRYGLRYLGILFEVDAAIVGAASAGTVEYQWLAGDTDTVGIYDAEWVVLLPSGEPLTVPNGQNFELEISPKVGTTAYTLLHGGNQTQLLLRRLRTRLADTERSLYPADGDLAQALLDNFESWIFHTQSLALLYATTDLAYLTTNPLNTTLVLTRREQDVWVLLTACEVLEREVLEASRIAASMASPAGRANTTEVYKALRLALIDAEDALTVKLGEKDSPLKFIDLTLSDGARFIADQGF